MFNDLKTQRFKDVKIQRRIQRFKDSKKNSKIQKFKDSKIQRVRYSEILTLKHLKIQNIEY